MAVGTARDFQSRNSQDDKRQTGAGSPTSDVKKELTTIVGPSRYKEEGL